MTETFSRPENLKQMVSLKRKSVGAEAIWLVDVAALRDVNL